MTEPDNDNLHKVLLDERDHSELTSGEDLPDAGLRRNRGRSQVFSIRLDPNDIAAIESIDRRMDVPVSTLVRGWVLRGMVEHDEQSLMTVFQRLRVDIEHLGELLR